MQATTIKLDGALVRRLKTVKPPHETLSGFVRSILDSEIRRQKLRAAAEDYAEFLRAHSDEAESMDAWATAPLQARTKARRTK